jgi:hypothetical protein
VRRCLAEAAGLRVLQARASLPEADLDFGIVDQLLRPAGEAVLTAETGAPTSSFAVGAPPWTAPTRTSPPTGPTGNGGC